MPRTAYKCKDGETRLFDSNSEVEFVQYCEANNIKIVDYNVDKHLKFELFPKPPESERDIQLEKKLIRTGFIYEAKKMRNGEHSTKSFDFVLEIEGVEYLVEIKGEFSNLDKMDYREKSFYTVWAWQKNLFLQVHKRPLIVFISKSYKGSRIWRAEYYKP